MYHYGAGTDVGNVRDNNEDSFVCDDQKDLWIVADGMGGLGFGEVASAITTFTVTRQVRDGHGINQAIELAHKNIKEYAESDGLGTNMGTTIVLLLSHGSLYNVFWVGDSRAYLFDQERLKQITIDHSLVQSLIDQGELTREEASTDPRKNAVTRALGVQELETVRADSISERWKTGQKILLCSDGLTDCVSDVDIEKLMRLGGDDQEITDRLIEAALEGGGKDNVTVIVVSAPLTAKVADTDTHVPAGLKSDDTVVPVLDDTLSRSGNPQAALTSSGIQNIVLGRSESDGSELEDTVFKTISDKYTETKSSTPHTRDIMITVNNKNVASDTGEQLNLNIDNDSTLAIHDANTGRTNTRSTNKSVVGFESAPLADAETSPKQTQEKHKSHRYKRQLAVAAAIFLAVFVASLQFDRSEPAQPTILHADSPELTPRLDRDLPSFDESLFNTMVFVEEGKTLQVGLFQKLLGAEAQQFELTKLGLSPHIEKRSSEGAIKYAVIIGPLDDPDHEQTLAKLDANEFRYFHTSARGS
ncbi:MAG: serine/threonine protein phosphatase PrpC [Candidatus Azotimanducaceae bacterium]